MKAFAMRWPDDVLERTKAAAAEAGTSLTAYVREATEARLGAPLLTSIRMEPSTVNGDVPRDTCAHCDAKTPFHHPGCPQSSSFGRPMPDQCAHPFRDAANRCRACGGQR